MYNLAWDDMLNSHSRIYRNLRLVPAVSVDERHGPKPIFIGMGRSEIAATDPVIMWKTGGDTVNTGKTCSHITEDAGSSSAGQPNGLF